MTFMQKLRKSAKNKKGFTLIELIIVIAIIAILVALIAPQLVKYLGSAKSTAVSANAKTAYTSVQTFLTDKEKDGTRVAAGVYELPVTKAENGTITMGGDNVVNKPLAGIDTYLPPTDMVGVTVLVKVGEKAVLEGVKWTSAAGDFATYPSNVQVEKASTPEE